MYYLFDGSYPGFLSCVFESFERKEADIIPLTEEEYQGSFFDESRLISSSLEKAERVHNGLVKKLGRNTSRDFFRVFLSEDRKAWSASLRIIREVFTGNEVVLSNFGDEDVLYFSQALKKVSRERHRMKAFVRFQKDSDGLYFSIIEPDFNVLPLISDFFRKRYADQSWLIYDVKRKYGLLYNQQFVSEVTLTSGEKNALVGRAAVITLDDRDEQFRCLWKQYFKSTNIESRRNMKLHLQYVPRRYWKYLVEKME